MTEPVTAPLLQTKLFIPPLKPGLVRRPHLTRKIDDAFRQGARLVLVSAPAGYGKSTLVGEWAHAQRAPNRQPGSAPVSWLSLDEEENDEILFWRYVVAALQQAYPALGEGTAAYFQSQPTPVRGLLTHLLNRAISLLQTSPPQAGAWQLTLVLDDYHLITNPAIHEGVSFLLEHLPPPLRLLLITRADPPLPVARMQARAEAVSLRAHELRFGREETETFLNEVKALDLSPEQIATLARRTEGWAAGLQMAALAVASVALSAEGASVATFVDQFGGARRYFLDYLLEEILSRQPAPVREFLLQTSILERFCPALCAAVVEEARDAGDREAQLAATGREQKRAATILASLDRANLFIIPLDQERQWYRYHHLFADLLRARLRQHRPERIPELHRRAALWYREQGLATEAIGHALKADDGWLAADLVERHTHPLLIHGDIHTLLRSIEALPEDAARGRPWLGVYQAWALTLGGQYELAAALVSRVEARLQAGEHESPAARPLPAGSGEAPGHGALRGHVAAIRAFQAATTVVEGAAIRHARQALALLPAEALWPRGLAEWSLGYAHRMSGRLAEAAPHFEEVIRIGHSHGDLQAVASAQYDLALVRREQGRLQEAEHLLEEILALAAARGAENVGYLGRVEAGLAGVRLVQNRLADARRHVARSLELNEAWQNPNHDYRTYLVLAQLELAEGEVAAAEAAWSQAQTTGRRFPIVPILRDQAAALRLDLWLARNDLAAARRWLESEGWTEQRLVERAGAGGSNQQTVLAAVRVLLAHARRAETAQSHAIVIQALEQVLGQSRPAGHVETTITALALQALAWQAQRKSEQALAALAEALRLAAPAGFARIFLDEGAPMQALLAGLAPALHDHYLDDKRVLSFLERVRGAFPDLTSGRPGPADRPGIANAALVEPLSDRELEVLALLAEGLTNRQIAGRLVIARGTVKAHAASIYGKLGVHNRTEAAARARDLGII